MKETVEILSGQRGKRISKLSTSASLSEVINKVNEIIERLE